MSEPAAINEGLLDAAVSAFYTDQNNPISLAELPVGARLLLRCRLDWRFATVCAADSERVTLTVCSPKGGTYRIRRAPDAKLFYEGNIPVMGDPGDWRIHLARYDRRW